jgi:tetratricopeptide (TPR) repeat protein
LVSVNDQPLKEGIDEIPDAFARERQELREIVAAVRRALADRESADPGFLTKAAGRLRRIPPRVDTDAQFEALQGICRYFLAQDKDLPFAMEAGAYLVRLARELDRKPELLNGLFMQAFIATQLDNQIEAVEACALAREVAISIGSAVGELRAVLNGAATYINVGHYHEALELLRTALTLGDLCSEQDAARFEWAILANIATCHLFLNQFVDALNAARAARALAPEPQDPHTAGNRAILEFTLIRVLMALGRGSEGRALLEPMARYVKLAGSVRARIDYSTAVGLVEVAEGHSDRGRSRIHAAREKASLVSSTLPDVLGAQATMHRLLGETDEASRVQGELDGILKSRQETARLRAALVLGSIGTAGQANRVTEYDRRLDAARERLLRSDAH